jgi:hypothetical protein
MPGNHDPDGPDRLWDRIAEMAPNNIRFLREETPVEIDNDVWLLPAPWQRLHHGRDLTDWMDSADTPDGAIRIGIAHGSIKTFGTKHEGREDGESAAIIPPDRASRANLNYLALGDWHALTEINAHTFYAGTPEPDRFKSGERGQVLLVEVNDVGSPPIVKSLPTAHFDWVALDISLRVGQVAAAIEEIETRIAAGQPARQTLVQITVNGATTVEEWQQFETSIETLTERCAYLVLRGAEAINLKIVAEDLDALDAQGSVRQAAEALNVKRVNPDLSQEDRELAAEALRLLFSYAATSSPLDGSQKTADVS